MEIEERLDVIGTETIVQGLVVAAILRALPQDERNRIDSWTHTALAGMYEAAPAGSKEHAIYLHGLRSLEELFQAAESGTVRGR